MKILMVLSSSRFSGAENVVCQIINMFRNNTELEFVYCSCDGEIAKTLAEKNIAFAPMSDIDPKELKRVISEVKPDIIHAHDMRASFVAARACGKIPMISHIHNNAFDARKITPKSVAYLYAAKKAKHIFWVSNSSLEGYIFRKSVAKKSDVLYNIIDVNELYQRMLSDSEEYSYDIIYLGRLSYPKNPQRLMTVFSKVIAKKPDVKIAVVGTGELEAETKALAKEFGIEENIDFLGFRSNPSKILHSSKVMIMTSRWEGTPMCALEAMALKVPIISTPVDGLKDLVINGETGYLSDNDDELADRIVEVINNKELHERLSANIYEKALKYNDVEIYSNRIYNEYKKVKGN